MSKLFEKFYTDLVMIDKKTVSDGLGGFETSLVEGASFKGSVVTKATTEQRQAETQIGQATYTVTVPYMSSWSTTTFSRGLRMARYLGLQVTV